MARGRKPRSFYMTAEGQTDALNITERPEVKALIARAHEKMKGTGKGMGILNFVPADARALLQSGFTFIAVASDASIVARRSEALLQEIKSAL